VRRKFLLTGTAAWNYVAITNGSWEFVRIERASHQSVLRQTAGIYSATHIPRRPYEISVKRSDPGNTPHIMVDGTPLWVMSFLYLIQHEERESNCNFGVRPVVMMLAEEITRHFSCQIRRAGLQETI